VERVVRAVEVTALPKAPEIVLGIVNVGGRVIPVADVRKRFGLPERPIDPADQLIIARTPARTVALAVDVAHGVATIPETELEQAGAIVGGLDYLSGVAKLATGLVLIHDLGSFLSLPEEQALEKAFRAREPDS
jgi:purine-binding chemotaxis protein CheW